MKQHMQSQATVNTNCSCYCCMKKLVWAGGTSPRLILKTKNSRKITQTVDTGAYHHIFRSLEFLGEGRSTMFWSLGRGVKLAMPDFAEVFSRKLESKGAYINLPRGVGSRFLHLRQ